MSGVDSETGKQYLSLFVEITAMRKGMQASFDVIRERTKDEVQMESSKAL
jgi:hypothetical protein